MFMLIINRLEFLNPKNQLDFIRDQNKTLEKYAGRDLKSRPTDLRWSAIPNQNIRVYPPTGEASPCLSVAPNFSRMILYFPPPFIIIPRIKDF